MRYLMASALALTLALTGATRSQPIDHSREPAEFALRLSLRDWMIVQRALMEMRERDPAANDVFVRLREQIN
jgi:hypothetical protein